MTKRILVKNETMDGLAGVTGWYAKNGYRAASGVARVSAEDGGCFMRIMIKEVAGE